MIVLRVRYGRSTFYWNLFIYIGYLLSLNLYADSVADTISATRVDQQRYCPLPDDANYTTVYREVSCRLSVFLGWQFSYVLSSCSSCHSMVTRGFRLTGGE